MPRPGEQQMLSLRSCNVVQTVKREAFRKEAHAALSYSLWLYPKYPSRCSNVAVAILIDWYLQVCVILIGQGCLSGFLQLLLVGPHDRFVNLDSGRGKGGLSDELL